MSTSELVLVRPTKAMEQEITEYKEEHFGAGDMQVHGSGAKLKRHCQQKVAFYF